MIFKFANQLYNNAAVLLCLATLGFAGNTIAGKLAVGEVSPMMIVFLRWAIVVLLLFSFQWQKLLTEITKIRKRLFWVLMMGGVGLTGFNSLFSIPDCSSSIKSLIPHLVNTKSAVNNQPIGNIYFDDK